MFGKCKMVSRLAVLALTSAALGVLDSPALAEIKSLSEPQNGTIEAGGKIKIHQGDSTVITVYGNGVDFANKVECLPGLGVKVSIKDKKAGDVLGKLGTLRLNVTVDAKALPIDQTIFIHYPVGQDKFTISTLKKGTPIPKRGDDCYDHFDVNATKYNRLNTYLLMLASHFVYEDTVGQPFKKSATALYKRWGIDVLEFISKGKGTGDTQCLVMSNNTMVLVSFRGSEVQRSFEATLKDWVLTDANIALVARKVYSTKTRDAKVHHGFANGVNIAYKEVKAEIEKQRGAKRKVWITGGSLGGSLATLMAYRLKRDGIPIQGVYTFANPRVGDSNFQDNFTELKLHHLRFHYQDDPGPMIPDDKLLGYRHVGTCCNMKKDGTINVNVAEHRVIIANPFEHVGQHYLRSIYAGLSAKDKLKVPLPPE